MRTSLKEFFTDYLQVHFHVEEMLAYSQDLIALASIPLHQYREPQPIP